MTAEQCCGLKSKMTLWFCKTIEKPIVTFTSVVLSAKVNQATTWAVYRAYRVPARNGAMSLKPGEILRAARSGQFLGLGQTGKSGKKLDVSPRH